MNKEEMVTSVITEIGNWQKDAYLYAWNTGPNGRSFGSEKINYAQFPEISETDFNNAVVELKKYVKEKLSGYGGREAISLSGREDGYNVWSFLIEPAGEFTKRKFNYHIRVARAVAL